MMGDGMMGGMCAGVMGIGLLVGLLLLVVIAYVAYRLGESRSNGRSSGEARSGRTSQSNEALDLARRRYAQGEISREEFEQFRRDLE